MKKKYEKPMVTIESFVVSEYIANCNMAVNFQDGGSNPCSIAMPGGVTLFASGGCSYQMGNNGDRYDKYCYHVPTGAYSFFRS